jgi:phosphatidylglycerol---prolipoprotein diacylglyceryl transferase
MLYVVRFFLETAMVMVPRVLRVGFVRLPMYGVCAAIGLIAGLGLSLKTARMVGLVAEQVWDAGLFAVVAAFVVSRLLLIAGDVLAFVRLPVVMLGLPSFTYGGMLLTAAVVVAYLRWKRLALLRVADAWAPCAALLAGMLSLGRFFEGTELGMPTRLPWGMVMPGSGSVRLHPVAVYSAIASGMLVVVLMGLLQRKMREGMVAAVALVVGGIAGFLLDMVMQPVEMRGSAWLDPAQWVGVGAMLAGGLMITFSKETT